MYHHLLSASPPAQLARARRIALALAALAALAALGIKGWRLAGAAQALRADVWALEQSAAARPDPAALGPLLRRARQDTAALRAEAAPLLPIAARLGWVPVYGQDLAAAPALLEFGERLTVAADETFAALAPLLDRPAAAEPLGVRLGRQLAAAQPRLAVARQALAQAAAADARIPAAALSPWLRQPVQRAEALLPAARDALDLAIAAPNLLGAGGPRSYLLLAQDVNELRATGGFIGAAGLLTVDAGRLGGLAIGDSAAVDNLAAQAYPAPPAPLLHYMGIELWTFRDANWSPDFPTSARAALDLYRLGQGRGAQGVIAFDQQLIQSLLSAIGPVELADRAAPIDAAGAIAYMRGEYNRNLRTDRKSFMAPLAQAIVEKLAHAGERDMLAVGRALLQALDQRHLQIYLDDPGAAAVLARRGWDGALHPGAQDFLMVVDSNLGYNKVNPNIGEALDYTVDLRDPAAPEATLTIRYRHRGSGPAGCVHFRHPRVTRYEDFFAGCYWDYIRALAPAGSQLVAASAQPTPGAWLLSGVGDDGAARLDAGDANTSAISTFLVVPVGGERRAIFRYRLPPTVLARDPAGWSYQLALQKQAGSAALPVAVTVRLPSSARLATTSQAPVATADGTLLFQLTLDRARQLAVVFRT